MIRMGRKMNSKQNRGVLSNFTWKFSERILSQLVTMIVSIVLARILAPSDYGIISIVTIFITIANVFVSDGIGSSLVQKKDADRLDYTTLLLFNVALSSLLYLIIFFAAPVIAAFYGEGYEIVTPVLRVLGIRIVLTGVNSIQTAYISKKLLFKKYFWSALIGTAVSAVVGIAMAYMGYGVWALVFQYLTSSTISMIVLVFTIGKYPILKFSYVRLKNLLGFGSKILATNLIGTLFTQIRALIIGKKYTSADLAYFDRGHQFPSLLVVNINSSITAVMFPRLALEQDDKSRVKAMMKQSLCFSSYILSPVLLGLAAVAPLFVSVLLTDAWLPCVPLLQLLCVYYLFWPIHSLNMQVMKALGEGNKYLLIEVIKTILDIAILLATFQGGVMQITVGMVVFSFLSVIVNAWPNKRLINYSAIAQLKDILPNIFNSIIMVAVVYAVGLINYNKIAVLAIQIVVGIIVYLLLSIITKRKEFFEIINLLKSKIGLINKKDSV